MKPNNWKRNSIIYIVAFLAVVILFSLLRPGTPQPEEVSLSQIITMSQEGKLQSIEFKSDTMIVTNIDGAKLTTPTGLHDPQNLKALQDMGLDLSPAKLPGGYK